jgi:DNA primase
LFPIFDVSGDPVALGGRALPGGPAPKYVNSPETPLYSKSRVLYGLNWARADVVRTGEAVLCEGYTDVIGVARAGVSRAVATCGTAVTDDHLRLLSRFSVRRLVLAYDADAAGQSATERFYEWERRHDLQVSVARLPPGTDPADLARSDPDGLRAALEGALPLLAFRIERALARADMRSPEGRARAAESAMVMVAQHPSELVRDQYVMSVAARCRVDPDRLRARLAGRDRPAGRRASFSASTPGPVAGPETEALKVVLHRPEALASRLHETLFADEVALAAYRALVGSPDLHRAIEAADPPAAALLHRLAAEDTDADPEDVLARLADGAARRVLAELEAEARVADDPTGYGPVVAWLKVTIEELRDPKTTREATDRLVGWLVDRFEVEG